jgi:hypothetical protein
VAHVKQSAKGTQRRHRNQWRPERDLQAFRAAHPTWQRKQPAARRLAKEAFSLAMPLSPTNPESQAEQRVPAVVHRSAFQTVCIM